MRFCVVAMRRKPRDRDILRWLDNSALTLSLHIVEFLMFRRYSYIIAETRSCVHGKRKRMQRHHPERPFQPNPLIVKPEMSILSSINRMSPICAPYLCAKDGLDIVLVSEHFAPVAAADLVRFGRFPKRPSSCESA